VLQRRTTYNRRICVAPIKFQLAYESDLEFVAKTMREVVDEQIGDIMSQKVKVYTSCRKRRWTNSK
jgi:small-conductance mechanosensitive channel